MSETDGIASEEQEPTFRDPHDSRDQNEWD